MKHVLTYHFITYQVARDHFSPIIIKNLACLISLYVLLLTKHQDRASLGYFPPSWALFGKKIVHNKIPTNYISDENFTIKILFKLVFLLLSGTCTIEHE